MKITVLFIAIALVGCAHKSVTAKPPAPAAQAAKKKPSWIKRHMGSLQGGPGGVTFLFNPFEADDDKNIPELHR